MSEYKPHVETMRAMIEEGLRVLLTGRELTRVLNGSELKVEVEPGINPEFFAVKKKEVNPVAIPTNV